MRILFKQKQKKMQKAKKFEIYEERKEDISQLKKRFPEVDLKQVIEIKKQIQQTINLNILDKLSDPIVKQ